MIKEKANIPIVVWWLGRCFLAFMMVVIGGLPRLTHSGLLIIKLNQIMEAMRPLDEQEWAVTFEQYKQFPEYQKLNYLFTLVDFKLSPYGNICTGFLAGL